MGVEVRRVPLDFVWPMNERWSGFVNPHYRQCDACEGRGATTAFKRLDEILHLLLVSGSDAYQGRSHPWMDASVLLDTRGKVVSNDILLLTNGLSERTPEFMGYDAIARHIATKKVIAAAGLPEDWGTCLECNGEGIHPEARADYEAWTETQPPTGEGWQMWETVSEGSPISPVFATPEELARHMAAHPWGIQRGTYEQWMATISQGSTLSMVMINGRILSGVEAAAP